MLVVASALTPVPIKGRQQTERPNRSLPIRARLVAITATGHWHVAGELDTGCFAGQARLEDSQLPWPRAAHRPTLLRSARTALEAQDLHSHRRPRIVRIGDDELSPALPSGTPG
jgi:hypothetical protein